MRTTALASIGAVALAFGMVASAQATLTGTTFEGNDGNLVPTAGALDWNNVSNRTLGIDKSADKADDAFGQGTKEDNSAVTIVDGSIPPNKNDLTRFYEASQQVSGGDIFLYLGWERLVNIGNANLDFEINQSATTGWSSTTTGPLTINRTAGDLLVTYDFGGSGTPTLGLNTWLTADAGNTASQCFSANALPCWGDHKTLGSTIAEGAVNTGDISDTIGSDNVLGGTGQPGTLTKGLFGEASINLTQAGVFPAGVCKAFGSTFLKSRSSSSFTAELKDFVAPRPVNISNCSSITIKKVTENEPTPGTQSFSYTTSSNLSSFSLKDGGSKTFNSLNAGTYSVTEGTLPSNWDLKSLTCDTSNGVSISGATATITLALGQNVSCTYKNHYTNSPTIATTLSSTSIVAGGAVHDSSALTGATSNAGGTVTYTVYTDDKCSTGAVDAGTKTVTNAAVPDSNSITFNTPGDYYWQAAYSGDGNNNPAKSTCTEEHLVVKTAPTIGTVLQHDVISAGDSVYDTATLTGATSDAGGTVTYHAYAGQNTCTGTDLLNSTKTVTNGIVPDSDAITINTAGYYSFQAVYSGDAKNDGATSVCSTEQLLVKANPSISTILSGTSVNVGSTVHDSSTLSGATADAGGTVTYTVYTNDTCSTGAQSAGTKTVTNGVVPNSDGITFNAAGTYYWQAVYSGDTKNNGATSVCTDEKLVVKKLQPSASTAQNVIPNDAFTLSGGFSPTGSVTFNLYGPSDATCSGTPALTQTVTVNGNGTYSTTNATFVASTEGTWRWMSSYTGDSNNQAATSACGVERFTIANS